MFDRRLHVSAGSNSPALLVLPATGLGRMLAPLTGDSLAELTSPKSGGWPAVALFVPKHTGQHDDLVLICSCRVMMRPLLACHAYK